MSHHHADVLIIGAGGAGLVTALAAAAEGASVIVVAKQPLGQGCNTAVSGGGFMMPTDKFSADDHRALTLEAGRHLNDPALVDILCSEADDARRWLESMLSAKLNPKHNGQGYWFTNGGAGFFDHLSRKVLTTKKIRILDGVSIVKLIQGNGQVYGAIGISTDTSTITIQATSTVLATGGYAGLNQRHDNPGDPIGEGIALAMNAGAKVRDMEFVQFYPLGLAETNLPTFMAFRPFPPEADVVNAAGESLIEKHLDTDDLNIAVGNHRDKFSQAIEQERKAGNVYLDLTKADWTQLDRWFSLQFLTRYDFPWQQKPARIAPIAHHTMGGITVNVDGQTNVANLYAVGETAAGLHGANRLGSNSLTECLVFGIRVGHHASGQSSISKLEVDKNDPQPMLLGFQNLDFIQELCWQHLGLTRTADGISTAMKALRTDTQTNSFRHQCALQIAATIATFALHRTESRGAHFRSDFPNEDEGQMRSLYARQLDGKIVFEPSSLP